MGVWRIWLRFAIRTGHRLIGFVLRIRNHKLRGIAGLDPLLRLHLLGFGPVPPQCFLTSRDLATEPIGLLIIDGRLTVSEREPVTSHQADRGPEACPEAS